MKKKETKEPQLGLSLPRWFAPASPVQTETQTTKEIPSGLPEGLCVICGKPVEITDGSDPDLTEVSHYLCEESAVIASGGVSHEETQRPEPSDNNPGQYAWKKPGMEKGDVMRPDLKKPKG